MSNTSKLVTIACLIGALPLAAQAADSDSLLSPNPLSSSANLRQGGFSMLRVSGGVPQSSSQMAPVLFGPDYLPKLKATAPSNDNAKQRLEGERFRFR
jgi:hypothetical protein